MKRYVFVAVAALMAAPGGVHANDDAGFYADVEFLMLSANVPTASFEKTFFREAAVDAFVDGTVDNDLQFGLRTVIGCEDCCGFGARFRWFTYDNDLDYSGVWNGGGGDIDVEGGIGIDADAFDFEFTQRGEFRRWDLVGSAGLRYASLDVFNRDIDFTVIGSALFTGDGIGGDFRGVGPTLALSGERQLGSSHFSLFAAARTSILFGDSDIQSPFRILQISVDDDFATVSEFQLGLNADKRVWGSTDLRGSVFWEAQRWDTSVGDIGFIGLGLRAGLLY